MSVTYAEVEKVALAFPGATKSITHGSPSWRIGKKFFTWVRPELESLVVHVDSIDERDGLIESDPALFHITDHYRDYPIVLVRLDKVSMKLVRAALERRFRSIATKKLVAEYEGRHR